MQILTKRSNGRKAIPSTGQGTDLLEVRPHLDDLNRMSVDNFDNDLGEFPSLAKYFYYEMDEPRTAVLPFFFS